MRLPGAQCPQGNPGRTLCVTFPTEFGQRLVRKGLRCSRWPNTHIPYLVRILPGHLIEPGALEKGQEKGKQKEKNKMENVNQGVHGAENASENVRHTAEQGLFWRNLNLQESCAKHRCVWRPRDPPPTRWCYFPLGGRSPSSEQRMK